MSGSKKLTHRETARSLMKSCSSTEYIVVFKKDASPDQIEKYASDVNSNGGKVKDVWTSGLKGFSAEIPSFFLTNLQSLTGDGPIDYIEEDSVVTTQ
ncbi:hypothetical protein BC629DRAFT_1589446 [Irpex lacteus]|nr:hypothetical protein BC629DRAFT_1589446 [Irpex lacteus]